MASRFAIAINCARTFQGAKDAIPARKIGFRKIYFAVPVCAARQVPKRKDVFASALQYNPDGPRGILIVTPRRM